ncbi:hypothetical protein B0T19DRAFT_159214 [Cercophora scortea]|uniref:Uncharacterized protein n=1 Tax=Cercophora scortea TaxID=314031 RepID=A0AAE0ILF5_9PEZI|nr:hypothetical protein B0T19DRAFT_159214 [Cercophora scortea]
MLSIPWWRPIFAPAIRNILMHACSACLLAAYVRCVLHPAARKGPACSLSLPPPPSAITALFFFLFPCAAKRRGVLSVCLSVRSGVYVHRRAGIYGCMASEQAEGCRSWWGKSSRVGYLVITSLPSYLPCLPGVPCLWYPERSFAGDENKMFSWKTKCQDALKESLVDLRLGCNLDSMYVREQVSRYIDLVRNQKESRGSTRRASPVPCSPSPR